MSQMADMPTTISFKAPTWMIERLRERAIAERRTVGNVVRVLLERQLTAPPEVTR